MTTYLDVGQFSRFVIAVIDRQSADIDGGRWQRPPQPRERREAASRCSRRAMNNSAPRSRGATLQHARALLGVAT